MLSKFIFTLFFMFTAIQAEEFQKASCQGVRTPVLLPLNHRSIPMPRPAPGEPLKVKVSAEILKVSIDTDKKEFETTLFLLQEWKDPRLAFKSKGTAEFKLIENPGSIWTPDLFFVNEITNQTNHNQNKKDTSFIRQYPDGKVLTIERKTVKVGCPVDLKAYPFDTQNCKLHIESYGYTIDELVIEWNVSEHKSPVTENLISADFVTSIKWGPGVTTFRGTTFSSPRIEFNLSRTPTTIILRVILPIAMIAIFSWISFLFTRKEIGARLTLCISPIMTYILQINFCTAFVVEPHYLTELDVWAATAFIALLGSLCECLFIACRRRKKNHCSDEGYRGIDFRSRVIFSFFVIVLDIITIVCIFLSRVL